MKDAQAEAAAAEAKKKAEDDAEAEKKRLVEDAVTTEREKYKVVMDASPFLTDEQKKDALDKTSQEVLKMALGDSVDQKDEKLSLDYLKGAFEIMKKSKKVEDESAADESGLKMKTKQNETGVDDDSRFEDYDKIFESIRTGDKQKELA